MRRSDGKLCNSVKERGKIWKDYMERTMNEKNDWDRKVESAVEGPIVCESRQVPQALNEMKIEKAPRPSEASLEFIAASWGVGIPVMAEICQKKMNLECQLNGI